MNGIELKKLRIESGVSQQGLADATGIAKGTIGRIEASGEDVKKADVLNALNKYFKIEAKTNPVIEAKPLRLADPYGFEATGERFYELPDETIIMQTPVIPIKAYASYLRGHADPEFYEGFETIAVPVEKRHFGTYLIFEIDGDSMVNITSPEMARKSIWPGQKVIGRNVKKEHWKYKLHINSNECWVIVHRTKGIVLKEITHHDVEKGEITLHSWNPDKDEYPDYNVLLNDIDQIFNVVDPYGKLR